MKTTDEVATLHASSAPRERVELDVGGMTCASCAMRVERALNRLDGVEATVNYATERASVAYDADRCDVDEMVGGVAALGYRASVRPPAGHVATGEHGGPNGHGGHDHGDERPHDLLVRLVVAAVFAAPVLAISMIGALQFDGWQWVVMALTAPVAIWAAWPFHRAMVVNARHGAASMDTLVSIGVLAAFSWSVWAVVFTPAGDWGQSMDMAGSGGDVPHLYFEVAAAVVVALVGGRYLEARAKRRGGDALRSLVELGAREASVLGAGGVEHRVPVDRLVVGDRFVVRPGEKVATDGVVVEGASSIDASLVTGESVPVDVSVGDAVAGATVNAGGRLVVEATRVGADTQLAQHGAPRRAGAERQGADPAPRRSRVGGVRPGGARARARHAGRLAGGHRRRLALVQRGRRRADHRLPVRPRPGDADGAPGGHRAGRSARHPHPRPRGPRVDPHDRHGRARQDRHRDHRDDGA